MPFEEFVQPGVVEDTRPLRPARHSFVLAESERLTGCFLLEVRQAPVVRLHESGGERITNLLQSQKRRDACVPMLHGQGFTRTGLPQDLLVGWIELAQVVELRPKPHRSDERFTELGALGLRGVGVRARSSNNASDMSPIALGRAAILGAVGERDRLNLVG